MEWKEYSFAQAIEAIASSLLIQHGGARHHSPQYLTQLFISIGTSIPTEWKTETKLVLCSRGFEFASLEEAISADIRTAYDSDKYAVFSAIRSLSIAAKKVMNDQVPNGLQSKLSDAGTAVPT